VAVIHLLTGEEIELDGTAEEAVAQLGQLGDGGAVRLSVRSGHTVYVNRRHITHVTEDALAIPDFG
jgi:hypothetical protein